MQFHDVLGFDPFFAEFDQLAQRLFSATDPGRAPHTPPGLALPTDVVRRGDDLILTMDLPGGDWEDLDLSLENRVLTITAHRAPSQADGDVVYLRGRLQGHIQQQFALPEGLNLENIQATYDNGVLNLRIPLAPTARPRHIPINHTGPQEIAS